MEECEKAIVVGFRVGMIPAGTKGMALLQMSYKMFETGTDPDDIPEEGMTFVLTPNQLAALLQDLTKPLLDFLPPHDDE